MLRAMPGVTAKNYVYLTNHVESIQALCAMPLAAIQELIGSEPGKKLYAFLHAAAT